MGDRFKKLKLDELKRVSPETFKNQPKIPLIVVLDNIRSLNNIGSIFRTCDAFRIQEVILTGITARPPHREIHKTALGATETIDWQYFESIKNAVMYVEEQGFSIVPVEQTENSTMMDKIELAKNQKVALVFGNEVEGVSEEYIKSSDLVIEIPQEGTKHSLNVSISAGIVIWEMFKILR